MESNARLRKGHRLLQLGVALLVFAALEGVVIPSLPVSRLGLSVHTLSAIQALLFLAFGLVWPRLVLENTASTVAWWTYVYSTFATLAAYVMAAIWGAGGSTIPLASGGALGSPAQEMAIRIVLFSAAPTFLIAMALVIRGLRMPSEAAMSVHRHSMAPSSR